MILSVFSGQYFWFDGQQYSTDEAFVNFVTAFRHHFSKVIFCDAVKSGAESQVYALDPSYTQVCPLPYFSLYSFRKNPLFVLPEVYRVVRDSINDWDVLWLHAPHPVSLIIAYVCTKFQKPFFLFLRQDLKLYVGHRNRGVRKIFGVLLAFLLEHTFRQVFRKSLTFAVGGELFDVYSRTGKWVRQVEVSLVSEKDVVRNVRDQIPEDEKCVRLLSVGRLDLEKGLKYLVYALSLLVSNGGSDFTLEFVGEGREKERLREQVNNLGLNRHVAFLGYVTHGPELYDLYKKNDILIIPSLTEGCPQVLFEAMACGIPVIATRVGGVPYLIEDGKNGLLINPASAREIVHAIRRLTDNPELGGRIAKEALSSVKKHTIEAKTSQMMNSVNRLLKP